MNRRGFLGALAALAGAKAIKVEAEPVPEPVPLPPITSGYLQHTPMDLNGQVWTLTSSAAGDTIWIKPNFGKEGVNWNYTSG